MLNLFVVSIAHPSLLQVFCIILCLFYILLLLGVSANDISSSGTTANCQLGVYTTVNHYHCLVCDEGYYDTIYDGCQASCSAPSFAMTTSRTCSPYCASSVVPAGSRYCYYGCMSACSENCVSCTGNICNVCTGCGNG